MEEQKVNTLINIGQGKVVEKVYDDLVSPAAKNVGIALSTIIDIGNTILWPVKWMNQKVKIYFETNLRKYEERLNQIPVENVTIVPTEISMPILDRFTYVTNEELSNAFVKLLTSASSTETINKAHPGFIYTIDRLAPDEAKILAYLRDKDEIPRIDIKYREDPSKAIFTHVGLNITGIESKINLDYPGNTDLYFDNLISLGIIKLEDYYHLDLEETYMQLESEWEAEIQNYRQEGIKDDFFKRQIKVDRKMYLVTSYGRLFMDACID